MTRTPLRRRLTAVAVASATALAMTTGTAVAEDTAATTAEGSTLYQPGAAENFSSGSAENHNAYTVAFTIVGQIMAVAIPLALVVGIGSIVTGGQLPQIQLPELPPLSA